MKKVCPVCHQEIAGPEIKGRSTRIDFKCSKCGAELRLDVGLVIILALVCAAPCIFFSYEIFYTFTLFVGDLVIFLAFVLLFWPFRRITVRERLPSP